VVDTSSTLHPRLIVQKETARDTDGSWWSSTKMIPPVRTSRPR
jgi:hypothetical protein